MDRRTIATELPVDLARTFAVLQHGPDDPTIIRRPGQVLRSTRTPAGPATVHLRELPGEGALEARAWGPGAGWVLDRAEDLVGLRDRAETFAPPPGPIARAHHDLPGLRIPRTGAVYEALVPAVIAQRVTTVEASRAYRQLVSRWGEPAPGPGDLVLVPEPGVLARIAYYDLHVLGIEKRRADAVRRVGAHAGRLEALAGGSLDAARSRLSELPGVGPWTVAEVALTALGDIDAVSVGDHNLKHVVCFALAGERRGSDARMLELLEPYAGHRARAVRLLITAGAGPARRTARQRIEPVARR